jgi:hypothetical protein
MSKLVVEKLKADWFNGMNCMVRTNGQSAQTGVRLDGFSAFHSKANRLSRYYFLMKRRGKYDFKRDVGKDAFYQGFGSTHSGWG